MYFWLCLIFVPYLLFSQERQELSTTEERQHKRLNIAEYPSEINPVFIAPFLARYAAENYPYVHPNLVAMAGFTAKYAAENPLQEIEEEAFLAVEYAAEQYEEALIEESQENSEPIDETVVQEESPEEACSCQNNEKHFEHEFEIGYQGAVGLRENGVTRNRPYFFARTVYHKEGNDQDSAIYAVEASIRAWYDFANHGKNFGKDIQIRSLFFDVTSDKWSLKTGFQEIAWGETFGLFIADLVNPRDLTDPFFNELAWIRIPVFAVNAQFFHEPWSFQVVFTPIPCNNWLPNKGSPWDVFPGVLDEAPVLGPHKFRVDRWGQDAEYGIRAGYLFESGIDLTLLYFRHWNRDPVYRLRVNEEGVPFLKPVLRRIHTIGASFSKAFDEIVLRGDTIYHVKEPWTVDAFGIVKRRNVWRTILGIDRTLDDGTIFGFQCHLDHWREGTLYYFSTRFVRDFCNGKFRFEFFLFQGLNIRDQWIQPQVTWRIGDNWNLLVRADFFDGKVGNGSPTFGFIGPYRFKDRIFVWLTRPF